VLRLQEDLYASAKKKPTKRAKRKVEILCNMLLYLDASHQVWGEGLEGEEEAR